MTNNDGTRGGVGVLSHRRRRVEIGVRRDDLPGTDGSAEATDELRKGSARTLARSVARSEAHVDAMLERRASLLERLFPNERQRALAQAEVELVRTEVDFRKRCLALVRESQLQSAEGLFNDYLIREKADIRSERAKFLLAKRHEVQVEFDHRYKEFNSHMEARYEEADKIRNEKIRDLEIERLDDSLLGFKATGDQLLAEFEAIISEQVRV